jgi:sulfonate transport system permease protein
VGLDRWRIILFAAGGGDAFMAGALSGELTAAMLASLGGPLSAARWGSRAAAAAAGPAPARRADIHPTLNVLRHIALFAWLPLLTAWVGNDNGGKIVFIALASFFPMFFSTLQAVQPAQSAA